MKNPTFILTLIFFLAYKTSTGQGTKIIALDHDNNGAQIIMSYDYSSGNYDTLYTIPGLSGMFNEECAIDGFNGRYFFGASITGYPPYSIFSFNITAKTLTHLFQMKPALEQGIEYDCFANSIIYRDTDTLRSFNLTSGTKSTICKIPHCKQILMSGYLRAYNYSDQQFMFVADLTGNSGYYYVLVDAYNGTLTDTSFIPTGQLVHYLTYDLATNSFFGAAGNGTTYKFDSVAGNKTLVCAPPANFNGSLNSQRAVFDSYNGYFLHPFYSSSSINKIAVTDVGNSTINRIDNLPDGSNFHRLYSMQRALIKLQNGVLIASYAATYEWYLNGVLIPGANSQTYTPAQSGDYTVKETHLDGRLTTSNIVTLTVTGTDNKQEVKNGFQIYPNPFSEQTNLLTENLFKNASLSIYNSLGKKVMQISDQSGESIIIHRDNLVAGMYFIQLTSDGKTYPPYKLIVTDN